MKAEIVEALYQVTGVGPTLNGRNGEGDRYYTDGEIHFARLVPRREENHNAAGGAQFTGHR